MADKSYILVVDRVYMKSVWGIFHMLNTVHPVRIYSKDRESVGKENISLKMDTLEPE